MKRFIKLCQAAFGAVLLGGLTLATSAKSQVIHNYSFTLDGIYTEMAAPVYIMMDGLARLPVETEFCGGYDPSCRVDAQTRQRLLTKRPALPGIAEAMDIKRISDLMFYPLMQSLDKSLINYAARQGYLEVYGMIVRQQCVPLERMQPYLMFLSALTWRARGGGLYDKIGDSTYITRSIWTEDTWRAFTQLYGLDALQARAAGRAMVLGLRDPWGDWIDVGRINRPINDHAHKGNAQQDYQQLVARGGRQVSDISGILARSGYETKAFKILASQMGACYLYAWNVFPKARPHGQDLRAPLNQITGDPITWGEMCFGAALGYGLSLTMAPSYGACGRL